MCFLSGEREGMVKEGMGADQGYSYSRRMKRPMVEAAWVTRWHNRSVWRTCRGIGAGCVEEMVCKRDPLAGERGKRNGISRFPKIAEVFRGFLGREEWLQQS